MKLFGRTVRRTAVTLGLIAFSLGLGACAVDLTEEDIRDLEQLAGPWEGWLDQAINPNPFADSPALFTVPAGSGILARDGITNRFRVSYNRSAPPTAWANLGAPTFVSKPAATTLDASFSVPEAQLKYQFAAFGRQADNRFYFSTWRVDTTQPFTAPATQVIGWIPVSPATFTSAPATTLAGNSLYVVGLRANNRHYLRRNPLTGSVVNPINPANWSAEFLAPALPAGWVAQGDPALANAVPINGRVELFVRAANAGVNRIFRARFVVANNTWDAAWVQIPTAALTVTTDPAAEYDNEDRITVYLKGSNNRIYQASETNGVWQQFTTIGNNTFTGSPAAAGNVPTPGSHWAVAKKTNNQLQLVATQQGH